MRCGWVTTCSSGSDERKPRTPDHVAPRRVVIIGGGFAGLFAARALRHSPVQVTVVDRTPHHLFQPLLYQCATGILSEGQIAVPLRSVLRHHENVDCVLAEVTDVDVAGRRVLGLLPHRTARRAALRRPHRRCRRCGSPTSVTTSSPSSLLA